MANQMIALGVRAPQMPDLGRATQQYGAMLGVAAQQRASQRQAEQAEQAMEIARNQEQRAATEHVTKQEIDRYAFLRNLYPTVRDDAGHQVWLNAVADASPQAAQVLRQIAPTYSPENSVRLLATADRMINLLASERNSQVVYGRNGEIYFAEFGGLPEGQGVFAPQMFRPDTSGGDGPPAAEGAAPPAAGAPVAPAATPTARVPRGGGDVTPQDLMGQGIPESAIPMGSPLMRPMSAEAGAGGATMMPASFGGEMGGVQPLTMETAPQIIQNAVQSRMIDQTHLQQLREMVGPDNERNLASWMQSNQIRIQPTGGMAQPSLRSAEYRPGMDAAPQLQQVQAVTGPGGVTYRPTGEVPRGRDPMQSAVPGSSQVPLERVEAEARARREPVAEAAARAAAEAEGRARATAEVTRETDTQTRVRGRRQVSSILNDIRNDYVTLNSLRAIPSTSRGGLENIVDYLGATALGREAQSAVGTRASRALNTVSNSRQLLTNAIKAATGMTAAQMSSNVELQLLLSSLSDPTQGFEAAIETIRRIDAEFGAPPETPTRAGGTPTSRRTPTRAQPARTGRTSRNTRVVYSGDR